MSQSIRFPFGKVFTGEVMASGQRTNTGLDTGRYGPPFKSMSDKLIEFEVPVIIWKFSDVESPFKLKSKSFQLYGTEVKLKIYETVDCCQIFLKNRKSSIDMDLMSAVALTNLAYDTNPKLFSDKRINLRLTNEHIIWHKTAAQLSSLEIRDSFTRQCAKSARDYFNMGYYFQIKFYPSVWNPEAVRPPQIGKHLELTQLGPISVCKDVSALLDDPSFSDVVIDCGDEPRVHAHWAVLAARSEFFAALFQDPQRPRDQPLKFEDVDPSALRQVLRFIYTGDVKDLDSENVHKVYVAADKYKVDSLKMKCGDFMTQMKDSAGVPKADAAGAEQKPSVEEAVLEHFKVIKNLFRSKEWQELSRIKPEIAEKTVKFLIGQSPTMMPLTE